MHRSLLVCDLYRTVICFHWLIPLLVSPRMDRSKEDIQQDGRAPEDQKAEKCSEASTEDEIGFSHNITMLLHLLSTFLGKIEKVTGGAAPECKQQLCDVVQQGVSRGIGRTSCLCFQDGSQAVVNWVSRSVNQ